MHLQTMHKKWSTYMALIVWGAAGFMAQPTIASFAVHFFALPLGLLAVIWLAHREGRITIKKED